MVDMSTDIIKRCPFCGGEVFVYYSGSQFQFAEVVCNECGCHSDRKKIEEAITAWNTRKPVERILERLEELMEKYMNNSEKAAELGKAYEKHVVYNGAKGMAFEKAIEIIQGECR